MIRDITKQLDEMAYLVKSSADTQKINAAIQSVRDLVKKSKQDISNGDSRALDQLDGELGTWQSKLEVILKEPVGRQGMTKHAQHWAEKLKEI